MAKKKKVALSSYDQFKKKVQSYFDERDIDRISRIVEKLRLSDPYAKSILVQENIETLVERQRNLDAGRISPVSIPGLALYLNWSTEKLLSYPPDGEFHSIIEYAKTKCESFLIDSIFSKRIDRATGSMMLQKYFGVEAVNGKGKIDKPRRSIADILNGIEEENKKHDEEKSRSKKNSR